MRCSAEGRMQRLRVQPQWYKRWDLAVTEREVSSGSQASGLGHCGAGIVLRNGKNGLGWAFWMLLFCLFSSRRTLTA